MKNNGENLGEFKGTTRQALLDMKSEMAELKQEIQSLNKRFWAILILLTVVMVEKLPGLVNTILAK